MAFRVYSSFRWLQMKTLDGSSRRGFLASGLAMAKAASAARTSESGQKPSAPVPESARQGAGLRYGVLGKTGLKVTRLGFGCLAVSDSSVLSKIGRASCRERG